jgi:hypothetical protein
MAERAAGYYWVREEAGYEQPEENRDPWEIARWCAEGEDRIWKDAHWKFFGSEGPAYPDHLEIGDRIPDHV